MTDIDGIVATKHSTYILSICTGKTSGISENRTFWLSSRDQFWIVSTVLVARYSSIKIFEIFTWVACQITSSRKHFSDRIKIVVTKWFGAGFCAIFIQHLIIACWAFQASLINRLKRERVNRVTFEKKDITRLSTALYLSVTDVLFWSIPFLSILVEYDILDAHLRTNQLPNLWYNSHLHFRILEWELD